MIVPLHNTGLSEKFGIAEQGSLTGQSSSKPTNKNKERVGGGGGAGGLKRQEVAHRGVYYRESLVCQKRKKLLSIKQQQQHEKRSDERCVGSSSFFSPLFTEEKSSLSEKRTGHSHKAAALTYQSVSYTHLTLPTRSTV